MKDFFQRQGATLEPEDLRRFARILLADVGPVLSGHEMVVRLLDSPEARDGMSPEVREALAGNRVYIAPESGRLHLPVVHQGTPLAVITGAPKSGRPLSDEAAGLLPVIVRLSLEKILMYKINITDRETGLNNEDYFRTFLRRHIQGSGRPSAGPGRLKPLSLEAAETDEGLTIVIGQVMGFDKLSAVRGRIEASRVLREMAGALKEAAPGAVCMARVDRDRIGMVLPREDVEAGLEAARSTAEWAGDGKAWDPPVELAFGVSSFPMDLADEIGVGEAPPGGGDPSEALMGKAEAALQCALGHEGDRVFSYGHVLERGGRVVQVLPFNRVVVNLGRNMGAREGQSFVLKGRDETEDDDFKGEVTLIEVNPGFSVGEVTRLKRSLSRIKAGDTLGLSRQPEDEPGRDRPAGEGGRDEVLGIPDHKAFMNFLTGRIEEDEVFALILVQVDGYERYRTTMGHIESDRQMKALCDLLAESLPEGAALGRFSAESLAAYLPGLDRDKAAALAETWRETVKSRHRQTVTLGLAVHPSGPFEKKDIVANAQKALEHAGFFGPASMAAFDSVSLNISGDKRFEAGDIEGAVEEYNRALTIDPDNLNVLNSLGVCHGHQGAIGEALKTFDRVLELDPQNLMAHYNRGFALGIDNRPREALDCFRRAASIDPSNFDVLFHLGKAALDLDLLDEALEHFEKASRLEGRRPIVFRYLGQALLQAERVTESIDAYKAAVRHDPEDAPSLSQLGVLYHQSGTDLDIAISLLRQSVEIDPSNGLFRLRLGRALIAAGDPVSAEREFADAIRLGARGREAYYEQAMAVLDQGRENEARNLLEKSLEADPEYKPAARALATLTPKPEADRPAE